MIRSMKACFFLVILVVAGCQSIQSGKTDGQKHFEVLVRPATHLVIRTGGLCHRRPENEVILLDTRDPVVITEWIQRFKLDVDNSVSFIEEKIDGEIVRSPIYFSSCMCCGSHTFSFLHDTNEIMTFSLHHDSHIRTRQIYGGGDVDLLPESRKKVTLELKRLKNQIPTSKPTVP